MEWCLLDYLCFTVIITCFRVIAPAVFWTFIALVCFWFFWGCCCVFAVIIMVRKRRTELPTASSGESSESTQEASGASGGSGGGRGSQQPAATPQQGATGMGFQGGRGWAPQSQQSGRGGYAGGRGPQRGGMAPQQQYTVPTEYQGRGRGGGAPPQQPPAAAAAYESGSRSRARVGGGRGVEPVSSGGPPSKPLSSDLHQATQASYAAGGTPHRVPSEASSSRQAAESLTQQLQKVSIQQEVPPSQAIQPVAPSSKSMRFPLRPGKGVTGKKCIVKANHFFAELPDKDLHQYDVCALSPYAFSLYFCAFLL